MTPDDRTRLRELLDKYNQTVVGPEDAAELYEQFVHGFYEHMPALLDAADERDALHRQDEVHWKTRRTLVRQIDALKAEVERLRQALVDITELSYCNYSRDTARAALKEKP